MGVCVGRSGRKPLFVPHGRQHSRSPMQAHTHVHAHGAGGRQYPWALRHALVLPGMPVACALWTDPRTYRRKNKMEAADASQPSRAASRCWRFTGDDGREALQSWALGATDGMRTLARDRRQRRGWSSSVVPTAHSVDCSRSAIAIRDGQWPQGGHCISDLPECGRSASHVRVVPSPPHRLVLTKRDSSGLEKHRIANDEHATLLGRKSSLSAFPSIANKNDTRTSVACEASVTWGGRPIL
jgi:hypothetical protein